MKKSINKIFIILLIIISIITAKYIYDKNNKDSKDDITVQSVSLSKEKNNLNNEINNLDTNVSNLQNQANTLQNEINASNENLKNIKTNTDAQEENTINELNTDIQEKNQTIKNLNAKITELSQQILKYKDAMTNINETINELSNTNKDSIKLLESAKKDINDMKNEILSSNQYIQELQNEINNIKIANAELTAKIDISISQINQIKSTFTVIYMNEDKEIYRESVAKGNDVKNVPTLTSKDGYDSSWSNTGKNITSDTVITAKYSPKTYTITYILGRSPTFCIHDVYKYDKNNKLHIDSLGDDFIIDFDSSTVKSNDENQIYTIVDNKFDTPNGTFTINTEFNLIYNVIGENNELKKNTFGELPTSYKCGETVKIDLNPSMYVNSVDTQGHAVDDIEGSRRPDSWDIYGDATVTMDFGYGYINSGNVYIKGKGNLIIFIRYSNQYI